jgi:hypothetical protein
LELCVLPESGELTLHKKESEELLNIFEQCACRTSMNIPCKLCILNASYGSKAVLIEALLYYRNIETKIKENTSWNLIFFLSAKGPSSQIIV